MQNLIKIGNRIFNTLQITSIELERQNGTFSDDEEQSPSFVRINFAATVGSEGVFYGDFVEFHGDEARLVRELFTEECMSELRHIYDDGELFADEVFSDEIKVFEVVKNATEDLTIREVAERAGIEIDTAKKLAEYLAWKDLIFEYNDGFKGMMYRKAED